MQGTTVTSFCSAVDPHCAWYVEKAFKFPCFVPGLLLHYRTEIMVYISGAYAGRGCTGCMCTPPPPPHLGKYSAQKCPKDERKFCPDMSA